MQVVAVDKSIEPYSYGVDVGGRTRETEGHRLRARGELDPPPPASQGPVSTASAGMEPPSPGRFGAAAFAAVTPR